MNCRNCSSDNTSVCQLDGIPLVNNFPNNQLFFDNGVVFCHECELTTHVCTISDEVIFNPHSYSFGDNFDRNKYQFYAEIISELNSQTFQKMSLLEIGGNNGWLGRALLENNVISEYNNIDPTCIENKHNVCGFFRPGLSLLKPDVILVSNVLGNINEPKALVHSLINSFPNALFMFSVQDSYEVFLQGFGELVFHEHKNYFDASSFKALFTEEYEWNYYYSNLHHRSLLATNFNISKLQQVEKKQKITPDLIFDCEKHYKERIARVINKIDIARKPIIGIGCGPRSVRMIYDITRQRPNCFMHIEEPLGSLKIGCHLPEIMTPIQSESDEVHPHFGYLWLPMHVTIPERYRLGHI